MSEQMWEQAERQHRFEMRQAHKGTHEDKRFARKARKQLRKLARREADDAEEVVYVLDD